METGKLQAELNATNAKVSILSEALAAKVQSIKLRPDDALLVLHKDIETAKRIGSELHSYLPEGLVMIVGDSNLIVANVSNAPAQVIKRLRQLIYPHYPWYVYVGRAIVRFVRVVRG